MGSSASTTKQVSSNRRATSDYGTKAVNNIHRMSLPASMATYHKNQLPPPPCPPVNRKHEIFQESEYKNVDEYILKMPQDINQSTFRELITYITTEFDGSELKRVRAIFRWVTSVDVFSVKMDTPPPRNSPLEYFLKIQNNHGNHAHLFSGLCQMANIHCTVINGMNKSAVYEIGKKADRGKMAAQWNALYVDGNWRLVDAFWACACVVGKKSGEWTLVDADGDIQENEESATEGETLHRINEFFFLTDPDQFILTHFPDDPKWQLLERPLSVGDFENHFYVRERFHILGLTEIDSTKTSCVVDTLDGEVEFCFGLPPERSSTYRFKYMLYRSRGEAVERNVDLFLDRFVLFEQRDNLLRFALRFPVKGSFKMDIYGLDVGDNSDVFDLCCTYIINCPHAKPNCLPLPDCPPLGWGPVAGTKAAGLTPVTHKQAEVTSKDGYVEIRLAKDRALAFHQLLKHTVIDEATLSKYVITQIENDEIVVYLRLPQKGEYALELFAQGLGEEGAASNALNYLIQCRNTDEGSQPFPNITNGLLGKNHIICKKFGVNTTKEYGGMLESKNGKLSLELVANADVELLGELHTNDGHAYGKMSSNVSNKGGKWKFDLNMPVKGEYSINVFARKKGDQGSQIYSVYSYIIRSDGSGEKRDDANGEVENIDTTIPTETVETSDSEVFIPVPHGCINAVAAIHRRNGTDPPDSNQIEFSSVEDMNLVKVQLKDYGEYMLNLYSLDENANVVQNVAKYQINRKRPGDIYQNNLKTIMDDIKTSRQNTTENLGKDDNKQHARKNLHNAIDLKDARFLEDTIKKCKDIGMDENDPLLVKAKHLLEILRAKEELMEATQKRKLSILEKAIAQAKSINSNHELDLQISLAVRLRDHLAKIEKLRHAVLNMESKTISEIKSYMNPPDGVHQCLMATFLLLGHPLKDLNAWPKVQVLMGKTGKESVMRKISQFDAQAVPIKAAQTAKKIVEPYNREQIRDVSAGAATFYIWTLGMIEEVESYGGSEQNDPLRLRK
ncbi:hypothetical protein Btru_065262 [Bulinus truncatus]|nr:hypothetical protein Btru_065262 [Bulinus truncatus]